jgi:hypothetical protein
VEHAEFLAVVEKCRAHRGALTVVREAGRLLEKPPLAFAQLEKLIQEWSKPGPIDRAAKLAIQVLDREDTATPNVARAKELPSALLLATGERAAEHERQTVASDVKTTP